MRIPNELNRKQSEPLDRLASLARRDVGLYVMLVERSIIGMRAHPAAVDEKPDRHRNGDAPEKIRNSVKWIHLESQNRLPRWRAYIRSRISFFFLLYSSSVMSDRIWMLISFSSCATSSAFGAGVSTFLDTCFCVPSTGTTVYPRAVIH